MRACQAALVLLIAGCLLQSVISLPLLSGSSQTHQLSPGFQHSEVYRLQKREQRSKWSLNPVNLKFPPWKGKSGLWSRRKPKPLPTGTLPNTGGGTTGHSPRKSSLIGIGLPMNDEQQKEGFEPGSGYDSMASEKDMLWRNAEMQLNHAPTSHSIEAPPMLPWDKQSDDSTISDLLSANKKLKNELNGHGSVIDPSGAWSKLEGKNWKDKQHSRESRFPELHTGFWKRDLEVRG